MKILVTGCAGFIGSHLCERLIFDGHTVLGVDNFDPFYAKSIKLRNLEQLNRQQRFIFHKVDIRSAEQVQDISGAFDCVVHLAAKAGVRPSIEQPGAYIDTNIAGTHNVLNLMLRHKVNKMVFASSSSVYGDTTEVPYNESAAVDFPISPYAFTKKSCELMLYTYFHLYRISTVALRFFTVYGPRQRPDLAINKFFTAIENEKPVTVFGDGTTSRDYTFIGDIVEGIIRAIHLVETQSPVFEVINLGNNRPVPLIDLIRKIEKTVEKHAHLVYQEMQPGDVQMTCADISKARRLLDYIPTTPLEEGLRKYYDWRNQQPA